MVWDTETCEAVLIKADPRPFSVSANFNDARYYNTDLGPLDVQGIDSKGRPYGVTASNLTRWGLIQPRDDLQRPHTITDPLQPSDD